MCGHRPLSSESERRSRPVFGAAVYQNQFVEVLDGRRVSTKFLLSCRREFGIIGSDG
jgi:hypothetical protein